MSHTATDPLNDEIDRVADEFEAAWQRGPRPEISFFLPMVPQTARAQLLNELVEVDWDYRRKAGEAPDPDRYPRELPELLGTSGEYLAQWPSLRTRLIARIGGDTKNDQTTIPDAPPAPDTGGEFPLVEGYWIIGVLGRGGMGDVFKAVQLGTRREVALKLMRGFFTSERARARFDREVELTARLDHPGIARIFDSGLHQSIYFYAMELIDGLPLDQHIQQRKLDRRQVLELFAEICRAVAHAHQRGVMHRDLKPSNIMVSGDGRPHVMDFGLAKALADSGSGAGWAAGPQAEVSIEGDRSGTPAFMSPEQAAGHVALLDTRTDVYSLGVILYRLLCGRLPHETGGGVIEIMRRICEDEPLRPSRCQQDIGSELESLLLKALAKKPDDRYASAADLARDINNYLHGEPLTARPPSTLYFLRKRLWKHRLPVTVAAAVLLILVSMAVVSYVNISHAKNVAVNAEAKAENEATLKEAARRQSELARADDLVSKADILGASGHWNQAKEAYSTAATIFTKEGAPPTRAKIGTWNANRVSPSPLNVFAGSNDFGGAAPTSLAISSNGRIAVAGARDGSVRVFDPATGQLVRALPASAGSIWSVALSNDGHRAVGGNADGNAVVWNVASGATERILPASGGWVTHVAISSDGHTALTASGETEATLVAQRNDTLCLWDLQNGTSDGGPGEATNAARIAALHQFDAVGRISGATFSPDGSQVLTFGQELASWDVASGKKIRVFPHREAVISAAFSSDGHSILTGGADGTIHLWDTDSGNQRKSFTGAGGAIVAVGYSADEQTIAYAGEDGTVRVVSIGTGANLRTYIGPASPRSDTAAVPVSAFSADGRFDLYSNADGSLTLWGLGETPEAKAFATDGSVADIAPFPGGEIVLARQQGGPAVCWDLATERKLQPSGWAPGQCDGLSVSPDGRWVAAVSGEHLTFWDGRTLAAPRSAALKRKSKQPVPLAFSSDGRLLLVPTLGNSVAIIDADANQELAQLHGHQDTVTSVAVSPDGHLAITGSQDTTARIWDISDPKAPREMAKLEGHVDAVNAVAFSPDGQTVATGGGNAEYEAGQDDFVIRLWNVAAPTAPLHLLAGHAKRVRALAFSADGLLLASGDDDGAIKLWDPRSGDELRTLPGHSGPVLSLTFVPGIGKLISGGEDQSIRQWNFDAPVQRANLKSPQSIAVSRSNDLASLAARGEWYAWAGIDDWAADFLSRASESLTPNDQLTLVRCYWSLGRLDEADAAFRGAPKIDFETAVVPRGYLRWQLDTIAAEKAHKAGSGAR